MIRPLIAVACALLLTACGASKPDPGNLSSYKGKTLVINYWAEWCTPCIKEIPELNELAEARPDLQVLGVNYDGAEGEALEAQVAALGIHFPTLLADPSAELGVDRPMVLPTTLVVDADGNVVNTLIGPQTLDSLLAGLRTES
ncbi:MAG: TlpA disulfide reductase family protein [Pseudomonadota bacterium]